MKGFNNEKKRTRHPRVAQVQAMQNILNLEEEEEEERKDKRILDAHSIWKIMKNIDSTLRKDDFNITCDNDHWFVKCKRCDSTMKWHGKFNMRMHLQGKRHLQTGVVKERRDDDEEQTATKRAKLVPIAEMVANSMATHNIDSIIERIITERLENIIKDKLEN